MRTVVPHPSLFNLRPGSSLHRLQFRTSIKSEQRIASGRKQYLSTVSTMAKEFPPEKVRAIVEEVARLLKERKETVSVAETVSIDFPRIEANWVADMWDYVL